MYKYFEYINILFNAVKMHYNQKNHYEYVSNLTEYMLTLKLKAYLYSFDYTIKQKDENFERYK